MTSVGVALTSGLREASSDHGAVDRLPEEMNDMKIRDDKEIEAVVVDGNGTETSHIIVTTINGKNGQPKQVQCQSRSAKHCHPVVLGSSSYIYPFLLLKYRLLAKW